MLFVCEWSKNVKYLLDKQYNTVHYSPGIATCLSSYEVVIQFSILFLKEQYIELKDLLN